MFIPIGTEIEARRPPVITTGLIAANFLVAILVLAASRTGDREVEELILSAAVRREGFRPWQLLSSMFMHDLSGVMHLLGNMLFLWVFGSAVEQRLGRVPFLVFYLLGGAVAGFAHVVFSAAPAVGASGAVAAVLGAYIVLFPLANVRVIFFLFIWGLGTIPAWWVIGLYFVIDVGSQIAELIGSPGRNVAYMAHIAGNLFGFGVAIALLYLKLVDRSQTDLLYLIKQAMRRRDMRVAAQRGAVWHGEIAKRDRLAQDADGDSSPTQRDAATDAATIQTGEANGKRGAAQKSAKRRSHAPPPPPPAASRLAPEECARRRGEIAQLLTSGDPAGAVAAYRRLVEDAPGLALPPAQQLDVANRLMAEDSIAEAAAAYELFLRTAPPGPQTDDVRLLLGLIYVRRQPDPARARPLLEQVRSRLRDEQRALADQLLSEILT